MGQMADDEQAAIVAGVDKVRTDCGARCSPSLSKYLNVFLSWKAPPPVFSARRSRSDASITCRSAMQG